MGYLDTIVFGSYEAGDEQSFHSVSVLRRLILKPASSLQERRLPQAERTR